MIEIRSDDDTEESGGIKTRRVYHYRVSTYTTATATSDGVVSNSYWPGFVFAKLYWQEFCICIVHMCGVEVTNN